jgi:tagaturonate reductase
MGYPVKVLQFGEGVFLRAFIDWMVERMNASGRFDGSVAIVKPRPGAFPEAYGRQGMRYTVSLKGTLDGRRVESREVVGCVSRLVNPYEDFGAFLGEAANPDLVLLVSNTTESGIAPSPSDRAEDRPALSFPGKLAQFLRARFEAFGGDPDKGLVILPCELIEDNGRVLRDLVLGHADRWYADSAFSAWLRDANTWLDSLVDRIVTGYTDAERAAVLAAEGRDDELVVVAEPYHLLALRGPESLEAVLPLRAAGLNVRWAEDISPYRELKVRLLNGSHTLMALCGLALGAAYVRDCLGMPLVMDALEAYQLGETIPTMAAPRAECEAYLESVLERFANPSLFHKLEGIASKSVSKWAARILPTLSAAGSRAGGRSDRPPVLASFPLAALVDRYTSGAAVQDEAPAIEWFASRAGAFASAPEAAMAEALSAMGPWSASLGGSADRRPIEIPGLAAEAARRLAAIRELGMERALAAATADSRKGSRR